MKKTEISAFISLPNLFTIINALLGLFAIYFIIKNNLVLSARMVLIAIFFDSFDGFLARKSNNIAEFGKSLDSLSDIISFGVVPAFVFIISSENILSLPIGFLYVIFGLLRLSRFNTLNSDEYVGLPITLGAIFVILLFLSGIPPTLNAIFVFITSILFISSFRLRRPSRRGKSLAMFSSIFILISLIPYPMIEILSRLLLFVLPTIFILYLFRYPQS
ncbi:MAG: CDP-diacylglycerol--serine O-phosphatidyltransferase [Candidatus Methanofastidiosa archaeon]|nr:CDP-diacylglycerol--serine O-phosphatidyltransferase [Candidatus Methanofastidiosa archaeon]